MEHTPAEKVDETMLIRIMRYCDGDLSAAEMKEVAAEIERDPQLQEIANDLRQGAAVTRATVTAIGDMPMPLKLARAVLGRPGGSRSLFLISSGIRKYAAALVVGAALGFLVANLPALTDRSGELRLAAAPDQATGIMDSSGFRSALHTALSKTGANAEIRYGTASNPKSGGLVTVTQWLKLGTDSDCAEFKHDLYESEALTTSYGLACQRPDHGWEIIQIPAK